MTKEQNKNQVAISGAEVGNSIIHNLFNDIDFDGLNGAISEMAKTNKDLTPDEKEMARNIIDEWNGSVIDRLRNKSRDMRGLLYFFRPESNGTVINNINLEDFGPEIAKNTNTVKEFEIVLSLIEQSRDIQNNKPVEQPRPANSTTEEEIERKNNYQTEMGLYELQRTRVNKETNIAIGKWKTIMCESNVVKEILAGARKFERGYDDMTRQAKEKSQLAKLNISISSDVVRKSLTELLTFTENM